MVNPNEKHNKKSRLKALPSNLSLFYKKVSSKKWDIIYHISLPILSGFSVIWLFAILIQFINSLVNKDYSNILTYGQISLTMFGFTLIGGIFEKNKPGEIEKRLLTSSLLFLITAMSYFFIYSITPYLLTTDYEFNSIQAILLFGSFYIAILISVYGFIMGFINLLKVLLQYRKSLD